MDMSNRDKFKEVMIKMMDAVTLDDNNNLVVVNEAADAEVEELLSELVLETARNWYSQLESAEDSLAGLEDEISFSEMNADPSHLVSPKLNVAPTVESILDEGDFDLHSILEMDDEDEFGPDDGDDDFEDMRRGDDEAGIGDDDLVGDEDDDDMGSIGGDYEDDQDMDDDEFDFSFLDDDDQDMDDFGGETDQDMDDFGDEEDQDMGDEDMDDFGEEDQDMDEM